MNSVKPATNSNPKSKKPPKSWNQNLPPIRNNTSPPDQTGKLPATRHFQLQDALRLASFIFLLAVASLLAAHPVEQKATIVITSYNLQNYISTEVSTKQQPPQPEDALPPSKSLLSIQTIVEILSGINPDVLFIMEIGEMETLFDFQNRLRLAGCHLPFHEWVRGADAHRHIALLTRLPIISRDSQDKVPFVLGGTPQLVARGFLDVTLDTGWLGPLRIIGAHLKSRRVVPNFDQAQFRLREATLLRQKIDQAFASQPDLKLVVLGDFNDLKNSPPIRTLIGSPGTPQFLVDTSLRDSRGETWTHYWKSADEYSRIDYILLSQSLLPFLDKSRSAIADPPNWELASDHRPISITLKPEQPTP